MQTRNHLLNLSGIRQTPLKRKRQFEGALGKSSKLKHPLLPGEGHGTYGLGECTLTFHDSVADDGALEGAPQ